MMSRRTWTGLVALLALAGWTVLVAFLFRRVTGLSYVAFALSAGVWFQVALALFSEVENLNEEPDLIAAHPLLYLSAWFFTCGLFLHSLGTELAPSSENRGKGMLDVLLAVPLLFALKIACIIVAVVILPANYFLFLLAGAPSRVFLRSNRVSYLTDSPGDRELCDVSVDDPIPEGARVLLLRSKPVTLTFAMSALILKAAEVLTT
jgi:hypothetical protein